MKNAFRFGKRSGDVPNRTWKIHSSLESPLNAVTRLTNSQSHENFGTEEENPVVQQPMEVLRRLMIASRKMSS